MRECKVEGDDCRLFL
jgi:hypothetical protein